MAARKLHKCHGCAVTVHENDLTLKKLRSWARLAHMMDKHPTEELEAFVAGRFS